MTLILIIFVKTYICSIAKLLNVYATVRIYPYFPAGGRVSCDYRPVCVSSGELSYIRHVFINVVRCKGIVMHNSPTSGFMKIGMFTAFSSGKLYACILSKWYDNVMCDVVKKTMLHKILKKWCNAIFVQFLMWDGKKNIISIMPHSHLNI